MSKFEIWIVFLTFSYVVATVLLFGVSVYQIYQYRKELRSRALFELIATNRELLMLGIQYPKLLKVFANTKDDIEEELLSRYAQLWINHAQAAWFRYVHRLLNNDEWVPLRKDLLNMFQDPEVKKRWEGSKWAYPKKFQSFIDNLQNS